MTLPTLPTPATATTPGTATTPATATAPATTPAPATATATAPAPAAPPPALPASARELAAATPAGRDRYVDALRVLAIGVVVLGHWLMATVSRGPDGAPQAGNALAVSPALPYLTWVFQVMPVFFLVGGFGHASALASLARRGGGYSDFVRSRASRLLRPTAVFLGVWSAVAATTELAGVQTGALRLAAGTVTQPLWFLGVYLGLVGLAPPMHRWHRRHGWRVPVLLGAAAVVVDAVRFGLHRPGVGMLNLALVWLAVHQLGYLYADGTLARGGRRLAWALAGGGLAAVLLLTILGPYPTSMVGLPGAPVSNMSPPTVALLAHAGWLTGLVLLVRGPATRLLARPRAWAVVVAANGMVMTVFLWHLTALFAAYALLLGLGVPLPAPGSGGWWLTRPGWLAALALLTAALVAAFRRAERPVTPEPAPPGRAAAVGAGLGMAAATVGVFGLSVVGLAGLLAGHAATVAVFPLTAPAALGLLAGGVATLAAAGRPHRSAR